MFCPLAVQASSSRGGKSGGAKGGGKKCNASNLSSSSAAGGAGGNASALAAARAESDEAERRRTDPLTDLHLWTFSRKNPLAGGAPPVDDPTWPGPLKEVSVDEGMNRRGRRDEGMLLVVGCLLLATNTRCFAFVSCLVVGMAHGGFLFVVLLCRRQFPRQQDVTVIFTWFLCAAAGDRREDVATYPGEPA